MPIDCEWPNAVRIGSRGASTLTDEELAERVRTSLAAPLGYPPLAAATAPGDRVALALSDGLPAVGPVAWGGLLATLDAGVSPERITFVGRPEPIERATLYLCSLDEKLLQSVAFKTHQPEDEQACAMLAVAPDGQPIRLNRELCDADVVVSFGCSAGGASDRRCDWLAGLYPSLSDTETLRASSKPGGDRPEQADKRSELIHEAAWRLGLALAVALVPGPAGQVADVVAGTPEELSRVVPERYHRVWGFPVDAIGDLVIADLGGPGPLQDWHALAAALDSADKCCSPGGAIAVRSKLNTPVGRSLSRLSEMDDLDQLQRQLRRDRTEDGPAALALARVLKRHTVYLLSALPAQIVEALGITPILDEEELDRLTARYQTVVVLEDAQFALPE